MLWTAGTLLKQTREGTGTYRIRAVYANQVYLGKGGCGITYLADCLEGEHQKKRVVIKTILDEHYDRPDFLQMKNDIIFLRYSYLQLVFVWTYSVLLIHVYDMMSSLIEAVTTIN